MNSQNHNNNITQFDDNLSVNSETVQLEPRILSMNQVSDKAPSKNELEEALMVLTAVLLQKGSLRSDSWEDFYDTLYSDSKPITIYKLNSDGARGKMCQEAAGAGKYGIMEILSAADVLWCTQERNSYCGQVYRQHTIPGLAAAHKIMTEAMPNAVETSSDIVWAAESAGSLSAFCNSSACAASLMITPRYIVKGEGCPPESKSTLVTPQQLIPCGFILRAGRLSKSGNAAIGSHSVVYQRPTKKEKIVIQWNNTSSFEYYSSAGLKHFICLIMANFEARSKPAIHGNLAGMVVNNSSSNRANNAMIIAQSGGRVHEDKMYGDQSRHHESTNMLADHVHKVAYGETSVQPGLKLHHINNPTLPRSEVMMPQKFINANSGNANQFAVKPLQLNSSEYEAPQVFSARGIEEPREAGGDDDARQNRPAVKRRVDQPMASSQSGMYAAYTAASAAPGPGARAPVHYYNEHTGL